MFQVKEGEMGTRCYVYVVVDIKNAKVCDIMFVGSEPTMAFNKYFPFKLFYMSGESFSDAYRRAVKEIQENKLYEWLLPFLKVKAIYENEREEYLYEETD